MVSLINYDVYDVIAFSHIVASCFSAAVCVQKGDDTPLCVEIPEFYERNPAGCFFLSPNFALSHLNSPNPSVN